MSMEEGVSLRTWSVPPRFIKKVVRVEGCAVALIKASRIKREGGLRKIRCAPPSSFKKPVTADFHKRVIGLGRFESWNRALRTTQRPIKSPGRDMALVGLGWAA